MNKAAFNPFRVAGNVVIDPEVCTSGYSYSTPSGLRQNVNLRMLTTNGVQTCHQSSAGEIFPEQAE